MLSGLRNGLITVGFKLLNVNVNCCSSENIKITYLCAVCFIWMPACMEMFFILGWNPLLHSVNWILSYLLKLWPTFLLQKATTESVGIKKKTTMQWFSILVQLFQLLKAAWKSFGLQLPSVSCSLAPREGEYYAVPPRQLYNPEG